MALFEAAVLLQDTQEEKTIVCDFFKLPEGVEAPTITIELSDKLRAVYRKVDAKYHFAPKYTFEKGKKHPVGELTNDPVQFCVELLQVGYKDSIGLIDKPSKAAILALVKREFGFAKKLSSKFVELFEHDELYLDSEEEEKN